MFIFYKNLIWVDIGLWKYIFCLSSNAAALKKKRYTMIKTTFHNHRRTRSNILVFETCVLTHPCLFFFFAI